MASSPATVKKAKAAQEMNAKGISVVKIADSLGVKVGRVYQFLQPNVHGPSCPVCGGIGVNSVINQAESIWT